MGSDPNVLDDVVQLAPEAFAAFDRVIATAAGTIEPPLYRRTRQQIVALLGVDDPTPENVARADDEHVTDDVCASLVEQFVLDVAAVTDEQRANLAAALGDAAASFVQCVYAIDFELRVRAVFRQLFATDPLGVRLAPSDAELWPVLEQMLTAIARLMALDPMTTELVRLRGARSHNCRFCQSLRNVRAVDDGGDEQHFDKVDRYEESDLPEAHKVALRLTDALLWRPARMPDGLVDQVHEFFSPAQVVELVLDVARNALNKFAVAMGIDGDGVGPNIGYYDTDEQGELVYGLTPRRAGT
jgi:alkylhydroperoxidase family enzyme